MAYTPAYACDLHCHTTRSDGHYTYLELIQRSAALGMKVIAITDHDVVPAVVLEMDGRTVPPRDYALSLGVHLILGIEYSCDTEVDDVHLLGLGCDWNDAGILREEENMKQSKIEAYRRLTEVLTANGITIGWAEVLENQGRPLRPEEVQRKHIFELIAAKGYAANWQEAKLLVRQNPVYNIKREKIDPRRAIETIHRAGGIAILAHPFLIDEEIVKGGRRITRAEYIEDLIAAGLDGIEASYTYDKTSYRGRFTPEEIEQLIRQAYQHRVKIISGGSDCHGDEKKGATNPRRIGERGVDWSYFTSNPSLVSLLR